MKKMALTIATAAAVTATAAMGADALAAFQLEYEEGVEHGKGIVGMPVEGRPAVDQWRGPVDLRGAMSVEQRVRAAWPGDDAWVTKVVDCESEFKVDAVNPGGCSGLFQFCGWARKTYGDPRGLSVEQQTAMAWQLYQDEGKGQWECSP